MSTAFLFPGQGAQYVGMGKDLYDAFSTARNTFDLADELSGIGLKAFCFNGPEESLKQTAITQPAIFTHSVAAFQILIEKGLQPDFVAGHSVGELAALVAAGVMSFEDGLHAVGVRGAAMQSAGKLREGTMAAILGLDDSDVEALCQDVAGVVTPANFNCPGQVVISGERSAVQRAMEEASTRGAKRAIELQVSGAFHSELMQPAVEALAKVLENIPFSPARIPVVPNVTTEPTTDPDQLKKLLVQQVVSPVRWTDSMRRLVAEGVDRAFEVGPGSTLKIMMRRIDRNITVQEAGTLDQIGDIQQ